MHSRPNLIVYIVDEFSIRLSCIPGILLLKPSVQILSLNKHHMAQDEVISKLLEYYT